MKGDFISCYLLLQPTLRNVSCEKNYFPSKQRYCRSTIKMHESSPVAAALCFIPSVWAVPSRYYIDLAGSEYSSSSSSKKIEPYFCNRASSCWKFCKKNINFDANFYATSSELRWLMWNNCPKFGLKVPHIWCDSHFQRQKVKRQGHQAH